MKQKQSKGHFLVLYDCLVASFTVMKQNHALIERVQSSDQVI